MTVLAAGAASSQALLVDPTGGSTIFAGGSGTSYDDSSSIRNLGGSFSLFGTNYTSISACVNGHFDGTSDGQYTNLALPVSDGVNRMAVLWDDLYIYGDGAAANMLMTDKSGAGFYAMSWLNVGHISSEVNRSTFQIAMFNTNMNVGGFNFLAGDIAFSYEACATPGTDSSGATVGLNNGAGGFATLPGTSNGVINNNALLPVYSASGQFVLFRWGGNNYTASIASVPEPTSMAVLGIGALALIRRRRNRR